MKTHYCPRSQGDEEQAACGTWLGEASNVSGDWSFVDCLRCTKAKEKICSAVVAEEHAIVEQMGDMANFMRNQNADASQQVTKHD